MEREEVKMKLFELAAQGVEVPRMEMIKTPEQIAGIREAGRLNTEVLDAVEKAIHVGMTTEEIDRIVYEYTVSHDATPACLNFEGFPKSVCTSVNDVICHASQAPMWSLKTVISSTSMPRPSTRDMLGMLPACSCSETCRTIAGIS